MSKKLYLAPAASGKTAYTVGLAHKAARSLASEVRVCVPGGLQAQAWRRGLADAGGAIGVHVLTFQRLVATCLNVAGEAYTELSDPVQYRLLGTIIDQLGLDYYAPLKNKPGFIQVSKDIIRELKSALVDPPAFRDAVAALGNEPRLSEIGEIFHAYQEQLETENWADLAGLRWLAVEALEGRSADACRDWPLLIVDGFSDFTPSQLKLLGLLADRVGEFIITLTRAEGVDYARYRFAQRAVEKELGIEGEPLPAITPKQRPQTLQKLARHIFSFSAADYYPDQGALALREVPDRVAEVRTALRWLKQRIVLDKFPADQVALLARSITPYRSYVRQIAAEFGLPICLVHGVPLQQNPAIVALLDLLRLHLPAEGEREASLTRRQVISAWRSPYFRWGIGDSELTTADADRLDILARQQRVVRGKAQWDAAFMIGAVARGDQQEEHEAGGDRLLTGSLVRKLREKFNHFLALTQPPLAAETVREYVSWLETIIGPDPQAPGSDGVVDSSLQITIQARSNPETEEEDVAALSALKDILRGLVWAEEAVGQRRSVSFISFFNELTGAITASSYSLEVQADKAEILVANVGDVRGLDFSAVAVMGLSEGSFPSPISEDPFLRDDDRQRLRDQFGFQLESSTQSSEREYFYEAVTRPRQKLLLTRPILADNGADWVASPFWEATRLLVGVTPELVRREDILPAAETASWAEWWESRAGSPSGMGPTNIEGRAEWQRIQTGSQIWKARMEAQASVWDGALESVSADLARAYGPQTMWSASRLEAYRTCGYLYFLQYVLRLAPLPEPAEGLDARQLGSLYHNIFEQVSQAQGLDVRDETKVREKVHDVATPVLDAAPEKEGFREAPWWAHTRQEIIDNVTRSVMALAADDYEFLRAEASFGFEEPALVLQDGEDKLLLHGYIDRVDRNVEGQIRIIDYKLGGKSAFSVRAFSEGKKLQLPLYALAAEEALQLGMVVDGFYWHFQQAEGSAFQLGKVEGGVTGAINTAVKYAWEAVHGIRRGEFSPRPPDGGCPAYCPAAGFCWQYTGRRW